ncbi:outer membrane autotransporter barrel domain protein [Burkholderia cepacia]|nr:outer membrane autotransporter barrel domain protein [Burkholderia cepacia]
MNDDRTVVDRGSTGIAIGTGEGQCSVSDFLDRTNTVRIISDDTRVGRIGIERTDACFPVHNHGAVTFHGTDMGDASARRKNSEGTVIDDS